MGSRGRSIRARIYFIVAIPLATMVGLLASVADSSVTNYDNLSRVPALVNTTALQASKFVTLLQAERRAAVVYLSSPSADGLGQYEADAGASAAGAAAFARAMTSQAVKSVENAQETAAIGGFEAAVGRLGGLRLEVEARKVSAFTALETYTQVIAQEPTIFRAEVASVTEGAPTRAGLGLIAAVTALEALDEQDATLAGALAAGAITPQERLFFSQAVGREQDDTGLYEALLTPAELAPLVRGPAAVNQAAQRIAQVQAAVGSGASLQEVEARSGLSGPSWEGATSRVAEASYAGGITAAGVVLAASDASASEARNQVVFSGLAGLAGLIATLVVTMLLGRSVNRRLDLLRTSAMALATVQLPSVVSRLRRGEAVDATAEAPLLRPGGDEIGQVGQAIDAVRQTAIRSAVDEARLRQSVNDMFVNLARRSQSLLQRQVTLLDGMKQRAGDPDVLGDLLKVDHLTTRMRRHAEGLIILSGTASGRSWSRPAKAIDVIQAAAAEIEDFARVTVSTRSSASLAGSAVSDVTHLLAELIENATTLSPPSTKVVVNGEDVARGLVIEIVDRGLGMSPGRMAELNERIASPPGVDAEGSQLGLFVVGQIARRHGIEVTLRRSPYGGTAAITLIPRRLLLGGAGLLEPVGGTPPDLDNFPIWSMVAPSGARTGSGPMPTAADAGPAGTGQGGDASRDWNGTGQADAPDPGDARQGPCVMRRGWQQAQAQSRRDTEDRNGS